MKSKNTPPHEIIIPFISVLFSGFFAPKRDYEDIYRNYDCHIHSIKLFGRYRLGYWVTYDK